jgi:uncharacterized repeat protein (TIGR01451 family)
MRSYRTIESNKRTVRDIFFLLAVAVALGLGLALTSPALGAELGSSSAQAASGSVSGSVSVTGGSAAGITVELRQRTNGGDDKVLATTTTDASGNYSFKGQPSAPNDAFYYVKFTGGTGTLAAWYSFPIIYLAGSDFTVPSVEMSDVQLLMAPGTTVSLPTRLQWNARRSGETYRIFIYAQGDSSKTVLDSGSLGMSTEFALSEGSLQDGAYEAVVQVRDAVVGYGQSQARFKFTIGKAAEGALSPGSGLGAGGSTGSAPESAPDAGQQQPEQSEPASPPSDPEAAPQPEAPQAPVAAGSPDLHLDLSADRAEIGRGESMVYKIEVTNKGSGAASGVVLTDKLPDGVTIDSASTHSTHGSIAVEGNNVTVQIGDLAPDGKAVVEIPVSVSTEAGSNLSNQASAQYQGAPSPVNSNAFIAQVAAPLSGAPAAPPQSQPAAPPAAQPQQPAASQPEAPARTQPQAPAKNPAAGQPAQPPASQPKSQPQSPPKKPASSMPQTGGSFPLVLALVILLVTLVARYLRGRTYRRV